MNWGKKQERMGTGEEKMKMMKVEKGEYGYVLEDVPHLTDYIPDLPVRLLLFLSSPFIVYALVL